MESRFDSSGNEKRGIDEQLDELAASIRKLSKNRKKHLQELMEKKVYTVEETAELLHVAPITIRRAIKAGKIKAFRVGPGVRSPLRISYAEIERLLGSNALDDQDKIS